jgi:alpha-1,2-mannosyltransferase
LRRWARLDRSGERELLTDVAWVVAAVAAYLFVDLAVGFVHDSLFVDLGVYRMGGRGIVDGAPLYELTYEVAGLPFTYTPFAALVFAPFALLERDTAATVWLAVTGAALARSCWLCARELHRRLGGVWPVGLAAAALAVLAVALEPVQATMEFGQVNVVIMWLVLEDLLRRRPSRVGGALVGIATGVKLIPGLFIVLLLVTRRVREAVVAMAAAAATVLAGFLVQPSSAWDYWTGIAYDSSRVGGVAYISNQSLDGVITRFTQPGGNKVLWAVASLVVVSVCLWAAQRLWRHDARLATVAVVALASLLISPISWSHHWLWLVVVVAALLDPVAGPRWLRIAAIALVVAAAASNVIWTVPNTSDLEYLHSAGQRLVGNAYTWLALGLVALFAAAAWRVDRPAPGVEPGAGDDAGEHLDVDRVPAI